MSTAGFPDASTQQAIPATYSANTNSYGFTLGGLETSFSFIVNLLSDSDCNGCNSFYNQSITPRVLPLQWSYSISISNLQSLTQPVFNYFSHSSRNIHSPRGGRPPLGDSHTNVEVSFPPWADSYPPGLTGGNAGGEPLGWTGGASGTYGGVEPTSTGANVPLGGNGFSMASLLELTAASSLFIPTFSNSTPFTPNTPIQVSNIPEGVGEVIIFIYAIPAVCNDSINDLSCGTFYNPPIYSTTGDAFYPSNQGAFISGISEGQLVNQQWTSEYYFNSSIYPGGDLFSSAVDINTLNSLVNSSLPSSVWPTHLLYLHADAQLPLSGPSGQLFSLFHLSWSPDSFAIGYNGKPQRL